MMRFKTEERPIAIQIFGYDPERLRWAAEIAEEAGADFVYINCGCPAKTFPGRRLPAKITGQEGMPGCFWGFQGNRAFSGRRAIFTVKKHFPSAISTVKT